MQLEQMMYEPMQSQRTESRRQQRYTTKSLEDMSETALYTGHLPPMGPSIGPSGYGGLLPPREEIGGGSAPLDSSIPFSEKIGKITFPGPGDGPIGGSRPLKLPTSIPDVGDLKLGGNNYKPIDTSIGRLNLEADGKSYKVFDPIKGGAPLTRLDLKGHEFGEKHLQHGHNDYFGRKGNEAADMFGEMYRKNPKIKFQWEK